MIGSARGNKSRKFGLFEFKGTLNFWSLVAAVAVAIVTWGLTELVPFLDGQEGTWAIVAGIASVVFKAAKEWLSDNEGRVR